MHWEELPKTKRNEETIREYEGAESRRMAAFLKRAAWLIPLIVLILWLLRG